MMSDNAEVASHWPSWCDDADEAAETVTTSEAWKDIVPIPQNEAENAIVPIDYSEAFKTIMGYFRAIMHKNERSERALWLSSAAIELNPGNYTAWYYRRLCLSELGFDLRRELDAVENLVGPNPKVYQLWYHRRELAELIGKSALDTELVYTESVFEADAKNYHAWAHRQYLLRVFLSEDDYRWSSELSFCENIIDEDVRNNSAWNHRYFTVRRGGKRSLSSEAIQTELGYCLGKLELAVENESCWNYLRGILELASSDSPLGDFKEKLETFMSAPKAKKSPGALAFYADWCLEYYSNEDAQKLAKQIFVDLRDNKDPVRSGYWDMRISLLGKKTE
eukprot:gb/GECG01001818.1/.p1 GENE.gb/GECG01001818.1/~~gb/GECG01001818.1/.p1  ORF type:complete len:336 (+),score=45.45 gb/GECG01001818.1/:1-1008(+)